MSSKLQNISLNRECLIERRKKGWNLPVQIESFLGQKSPALGGSLHNWLVWVQHVQIDQACLRVIQRNFKDVFAPSATSDAK